METTIAVTITIVSTSFIPTTTMVAIIIAASYSTGPEFVFSNIVLKESFYSYSRPKASKYLPHSFQITPTMTN